VKWLSSSILVVTLPLLFGCDDSEQARSRKLLAYFEDHKIGSNGDYGVFKSNALLESEPVVAVFGFYDNSKECQAISDRYNRDEPNSYRCQALNK